MFCGLPLIVIVCRRMLGREDDCKEEKKMSVARELHVLLTLHVL